jgi:fumarate reductase (CoM/CoB) subunit A
MDYKKIEIDVLIIGGGAAGTRAAIEASVNDARVALVNKGIISRSGLTPIAGYSYQAAFGHGDVRDNSEIHFRDTIREGRDLGDQNLVRVLAEEATERALDLERYGVKFEKKGDKFSQVIHPGQSYPRIIRIKGRAYSMIACLKRELKRHKNIDVFEDCITTTLLKDDSRVSGAIVLNLRDGSMYIFQAKAVIIATGGNHEIWEKTDSAPDSTGDGYALAYDIGAELADMEMMLFYPVVTIGPNVFPSVPQCLQYESLLEKKYLAGKLLNSRGEEFLPPGKLPVRDVLTRLIIEEIEKGRGTKRGGVYLDVSQSPKSREEIDRIIEEIGAEIQFKRLEYLGIDLRKDPVEVAPACHFNLGGIRINEKTETTVRGLYAAGETAGNIHGANRISGNALAETQVFGCRSGKFASEEAKKRRALPTIRRDEIHSELRRINSFFEGKKGGVRPIELKIKLKKIMTQYVSMKRNEGGIKIAVEKIKEMKIKDLPRIEIANIRTFNYELQEAIEIGFMLEVSEIVAEAALLRTESRGHHMRTDYSSTSSDWEKHTLIRKKGANIIRSTSPVVRIG